MPTAILVGVPSSIVPRIRKHVGSRVAVHALPMVQNGGFRLEAPPQEAARQITEYADGNGTNSYEKVLVLLLPYAKPPKEVSETANVLRELGAVVEHAELGLNAKAGQKWPSLDRLEKAFQDNLFKAICEFLDIHFPPPAVPSNLPTGWADFAQWCARELHGRLTLSNKAQHQVKGPDFNDPQMAARALLWLAEEYRTSRIGGSSFGNLKKPLGFDSLRNEACGGDWFKFDWNEGRVDVEWHIKNGGNTRDRSRCLRIYYFWDEPSETVVIAEMPAHRDTSAS